MKEASTVWHKAAVRFESELCRENAGGSTGELKVGDEGDSLV
jgi:hypothetical protein